MLLVFRTYLFLHEPIFATVREGLKARFYDIVMHAYGPPFLIAISGFNEHTRSRSRSSGRIDDPHLVIRELDFLNLRVETGKRHAQSLVQRVYGPITLSNRMFGFTFYQDLHTCLADHYRTIAPHRNMVPFNFERRFLMLQLFLDQQGEGAFSSFVLVPFVLEAFDLRSYGASFRRVRI